MGLCTYCQALPADLFDRSGKKVTKAPHQPSFAALEASVTQGCELCNLLVDSMHRHLPGNISSLEKGQEDAFSLRSDTAGQYFEVGNWVVGIIDGRIVPDGFVVDQKKDQTSNSEESQLKTIRSWLHTCQTHHPSCQHQNPTYAPTRLVKVSLPNPAFVQIVQIKSSPEILDKRYLALSHCWGLNMPESAKTFISNLPPKLNSIPTSNLPLTFQDAISIARRLSVEYVWIDSMCIIQDSKQDWEIEAADMTNVYSNAFLHYLRNKQYEQL